MIRRPPRSTLDRSSAASDVYKRQDQASGAENTKAEDAALERLGELNAAIDDHSASKLTALIEQLREIGVGPRSNTRVVVFSERIATLDWLAATVPKALKLKDKDVRVLHGGMADVKQMDVISEFGLAESGVKPVSYTHLTLPTSDLV